jgi:hypothetical protein
MSSNRRVTLLVRLPRNEFGAGDRSNRATTSLDRWFGSVVDESSVLSSQSTVRENIYVPSRCAQSDHRDSQTIATQQRIRKGLRLLKRKINRAIRKERDNAVVLRVMARRFPSDSNEASVIRLLCRRATRRVKRLKDVLAEFHAIWHPPPRTWRFYARYLGMLYAPRRWLYCRLKMKNENAVSEYYVKIPSISR